MLTAIQRRAFGCHLFKKICRNPVNTSCCLKLFCKECILTELPWNDFQCPFCSQLCERQNLKPNLVIAQILNKKKINVDIYIADVVY